MQPNYLHFLTNQIRLGAKTSHILHFKLTEEPTKAHDLEIKKITVDFICNETNFEQVTTVDIPILWELPLRSTKCPYFYTNAGVIFSDNAIKIHTGMMLNCFTK